MSVQRNQYIIYGVSVPKEMMKDKFYEKYELFMDDSAFNTKVNHVDGIFCIADDDGKWAVVGRVFEKSDNFECIPGHGILKFPEITPLESELIANAVKRNFGLEEDFSMMLVTKYR